MYTCSALFSSVFERWHQPNIDPMRRAAPSAWLRTTMVAGQGPDEETERLHYSGSVSAIPPTSSAARRRVSISRLSVSSRSAARRAALQQVRFERGAPRRVQARHDGGEGVAGAAHMGVGGPGDGGGFGDAYGVIDRSGAEVGQALDVNVSLEPGGKAFVPVNVLKACGTVLINAEPSAVAECVSPRSELIEARDEILANGAGNQAGFVQDPVEFESEGTQAVGLGVHESLGPPAHGFMVVRLEKGDRPLPCCEERVAGGGQNVLQVSEGRDCLAEFLPEDGGPRVHRPVGRQGVTVDGETAAATVRGPRGSREGHGMPRGGG